MTEPLQLLTLGVGDAFSEVYYHTSFVVIAGEHRLLIDAPEPIRKILRESTEQAGLPLRLDEIDDVILTHLHADHCSAFETICHWKKHFEGKLPTLHISPEVLEVIWEHRLRAVMGTTVDARTGEVHHNALTDYCHVRELAHGRENPIGPFQVSIRTTKHVIPTVGVIVRLGDTSVGYSCDTIFDPDHIAWLSGCDMIIHESNVGPHTSLEELLSLPEEVRAKLWLVHCPDDFDFDQSPLKCLRQGCLYNVNRTAADAAAAS